MLIRRYKKEMETDTIIAAYIYILFVHASFFLLNRCVIHLK